MDQKNTIVKCKAHPNCLFNHNGVCDNYVINIGADGKCEGYVETLPEGKNVIRGQRTKGNFLEDGWADPEIVEEVCKPFTDWDYAITPDICKSCKKVVYGQPCKWKDVAYGIWTCHEEDK